MPVIYDNQRRRFKVVSWEEYDRPSPPWWADSPEARERWYMGRRSSGNSGVSSAVYGLDYISRPYFDPYILGWVRAEGPEIVLTPESSGGRVTVEGPEIRIWR